MRESNCLYKQDKSGDVTVCHRLLACRAITQPTGCATIRLTSGIRFLEELDECHAPNDDFKRQSRPLLEKGCNTPEMLRLSGFINFFELAVHEESIQAYSSYVVHALVIKSIFVKNVSFFL